MTQFYERFALLSAFALVGLLVIAVLVDPPAGETASPKAVLDYKPETPTREQAGVKKFIPAKARGSEALLDGGEVRRADPGHVARSKNSAAVLDRTFAQMGYDLEAIGAGEREVPRIYLASMPGDIGEIRETKKRKALFFRAVLPLVLQVNEEIAKDRTRLRDLMAARKKGDKIGPIDRLWLIVMAERYRTGRGDLEALISRVDVIPPSLALAQAAEESGWGASRFVQEGNAMFGQWTWADVPGIVPKEREAGKTHKIKAFESLLQSVRAYARNLNTHRAYRHLRKARLELRRAGKPVPGITLAEQLTSYSERGPAYVKTLRSIIAVNKLSRFDGARLIEETDPRPVI